MRGPNGGVRVFHYFGYGSNMNRTSLRAKGVAPEHSRVATLPGWELLFNVHHWFRHEGGVGNVRPTDRPGARVIGVVHRISDTELARLDAVESYGVGYDRVTVTLDTEDGPVDALTYVGIPSYLDDRCRPTQRYLNILVAGAEHSGLPAPYIDELRAIPTHVAEDYPPFVPPQGDWPTFDRESLAEHPKLTALCGAVFDMSACRWQHETLWDLIGGKDMSLFHLKRLDTSDGTETLSDIAAQRFDDHQRRYMNAYLNEYAREYRYAGHYHYQTDHPGE